MIRRAFVFLHRWAGLAMAGFLVMVGLTGSLLAFNTELERLINPQLFAVSRPVVAPLDFMALTNHAEALVPNAEAASIWVEDLDQARVHMRPREDPITGHPAKLDFDQLFLDPRTGEELGRRRAGDLSQGLVNLMPFVYELHSSLTMGRAGIWILGIVALVWTIDCFIAFYLTLPAGMRRLWQRWRPAWGIKCRAGAFRLNFDLHRAGGLWVWAMLLVFAWSGVYMNLMDTAYAWVTGAVLDYRPVWSTVSALPHPLKNPRIDFRAAVVAGERLATEQAALNQITIERPVGIGYEPNRGVYFFAVRSSRDVRYKSGRTYLIFDADSGALRVVDLPTGQYSGNTVTAWLSALHVADIFGLPYRIFVSVLGVVITMLSATGIYIWWRKRAARISSARRTWPGDAKAMAESLARRSFEA